jgi:CHAT domain-containing protein
MQAGRIIHLATHGRWWRDDPFASSLDLRLRGPFDRYISAAEIYRDVSLSGAELVLLSACDTGRSPSLNHGIETYSGLDAAFLAKGARAVVSTLWPIDDLAAMLFMTSLHAELAGGHSLSIAFSRSVELLRAGAVANLADDHPVSAAIDAAGIAWRDVASERAHVLEATRTWSAFKVSGVPWLSRPVPEEHASRA